MSSTFLLGYGRSGCGVTESFPHAVPVEAVREMLNWQAVEVPVKADFMGQSIEIPGKKALVRIPGGHVLGVPSKKYAPHQYTQSLLGGITKILGTGDDGLAINAAGMTGDGAKAWISVALADTVSTPEGVEFLPFITGMGSHDSTIATQYKRTAMNMICNNMIGALHRDNGAGVVKIRHTSGSILRLESAQEALQILAQTQDEFSEQIRQLCQVDVTTSQWDAFVTAHSGLDSNVTEGRGHTMAENKAEALHGLYKSDPRCSPWAGTAWGVVQTVNTYERWVATVRGADRFERNANRDLTDHWDVVDSETLQSLERVLCVA